ncbi:hypothetical protein FACS1894127_6370 [Clostridia bacterium]|nr:hypothetical protein FACS1894127_6370 [Clostridia bacterium]
MTPVILLEALKETAGNATQNLELQVKGGERRSPGVYLMQLPDKDQETELVPYILLQLLTGKDDILTGKDPESECRIRIVVVTYADDAGVGAMDVLNVLIRLRTELSRSGQLADQFLLRHPLEYIVYPDDTGSYHLGEMMTIWEIPSVTRELDY